MLLQLPLGFEKVVNLICGKVTGRGSGNDSTASLPGRAQLRFQNIVFPDIVLV